MTVLAAAMLFFHCATFTSLVENDTRPAGERKYIYSGTRMHLGIITHPFEEDGKIEDVLWIPCALPFIALDLPLSLAADTLLLPVTLLMMFDETVFPPHKPGVSLACDCECILPDGSTIETRYESATGGQCMNRHRTDCSLVIDGKLVKAKQFCEMRNIAEKKSRN